VETSIASVVIDARALFPVRGIPPFPAAKRAALVSLQIEQLAADPNISTDGFVVADRDDPTQLLNGETLVIAGSELDASARGACRETFAAIHLDKVTVAVRPPSATNGVPVTCSPTRAGPPERYCFGGAPSVGLAPPEA
jgi:hypothetical protein